MRVITSSARLHPYFTGRRVCVGGGGGDFTKNLMDPGPIFQDIGPKRPKGRCLASKVQEHGILYILNIKVVFSPWRIAKQNRPQISTHGALNFEAPSPPTSLLSLPPPLRFWHAHIARFGANILTFSPFFPSCLATGARTKSFFPPIFSQTLVSPYEEEGGEAPPTILPLRILLLHSFLTHPHFSQDLN